MTGEIRYVKGKPDVLKDIVMAVDTRRERLVTDFVGQDRRTVFEPKRIVMDRANDTFLTSRDSPEASFATLEDLGEASFAGQQRETAWDDTTLRVSRAKRFGRISIRHFSIPARDSSPRRSRPSTSMARSGAACSSRFRTP